MVSENREEFIVENIPLVHSVANRFRSRGIDYEDLFQAGCIGLIKAVDGFDSNRGYCFSTYAVPVIMGEIKRLFRDGGAIKISRSLKDKSIKVQRARQKFLSLNNREPTVSELSDQCGISIEELPEILNILTPVMSLSNELEGESNEIDIPIDESEMIFDRLSIALAMDKLKESDKKLLLLRYFEGKTQCECAKALSISQVQVSRREKQLLCKLRELLK